VDGVNFQPIDSNSQAVSLPGLFFGITLSSTGTFTGTLTEGPAPAFATFVVGNDDLVGPTPSEKLLVAGVPAVDAAGDVAFRAILSGTGASSSVITTGILLYSGSIPAFVASTGQPAPGTTGTFSALADPVLSGSGAVAFIGSLKLGAGVTAANAKGVWVSTGGTTTLAARIGQTAPTGLNFAVPVTFSSINQIGVDNAGGLTLLAGLTGSGVRTTALFGADANGDLILLAYRGASGQLAVPELNVLMPLPYVSGQSRSLDTVNGNVTLFGPLESATTTSIAAFVRGASGFTESFVAESGSAVPGLSGVTYRYFDEPAINGAGDVAFFAGLSGSGIKITNSTGIYLDKGSNAGFIARAGDSAPGTTGAFSGFGHPVLNNNGAAAFVGTLTGTDGVTPAPGAGIWSNAGGTLTQIASEGSAAPGGGTFSSFVQFVLPDVGGVVFLANLSGLPATQSQGLWAVWNGELTRVVGTGDTLDLHGIAKTVKTIGIFHEVPTALGQSRSFDASTGDLVYTATFTDGTWGIYEVTPP